MAPNTKYLAAKLRAFKSKDSTTIKGYRHGRNYPLVNDGRRIHESLNLESVLRVIKAINWVMLPYTGDFERNSGAMAYRLPAVFCGVGSVDYEAPLMRSCIYYDRLEWRYAVRLRWQKESVQACSTGDNCQSDKED